MMITLILIACLAVGCARVEGVTLETIQCDLYHCQNVCYDDSDDKLVSLDINYDCDDPANVTIVPPAATENNTLYSLRHNNSCITRLPWNLCDYPNIVSLVVVNTSLASLPSLACLQHLKDLDLSYNELQVVNDGVFRDLIKLRSINLSYNAITSVGHNVFTENLERIMIVTLEGNQLTTAEAWPMRIPHPFCLFSVSNNRITRFSNEARWKFNKTQQYGYGWYDLTYNNFSTWISEQLFSYGFGELNDLGFLSRWVFDLRHNPWTCDCKFHSFRKLAGNFAKIRKKPFFDLKCNSPAQFHGRRVLDLNLEDFICNVTEDCPDECLCQIQPEKGIMFVNCEKKGLTALPPVLPEGKIKLIISLNAIHILDSRPYLNRLQYMDISNNGLRYIQPDAIDKMKNRRAKLNISYNQLNYLPGEIQDLNSVWLNNNKFICDCNSTWMVKWLQVISSNVNISSVKCSLANTGETIAVIRADDSFLQCSRTLTIILSCVFGSLIMISIIGILVYCLFKYEIELMFKTRISKVGKPHDDFTNDVYICLDEEHEKDRIWVVHKLLPLLEGSHRMKVYYPPRDTIPGSVAADEFIKQLKKSRSALVVLSQSYLDNPQKHFEFSTAYDVIIKSNAERFIVIKFPGVRWEGLRKLRALMRLKMFIELDDPNLKRKILSMICTKKLNGNENGPDIAASRL